MTEFVADTNLFYSKPELIERVAEEQNMRPRVSTISALEILCVERPEELGRRQNAAKCFLHFKDHVIEDNEALHARLLGYEPGEGTEQNYIEALERLVKMADTSEAEQARVGLKFQPAIDAKQEASAAFVKKFENIFAAYRGRVIAAEAKLGAPIKFAVSHDPALLRRIVDHFRPDIELAHLDRISKVATDLGWPGENSNHPSVVARYIDLYLALIIKKTREGSLHINDFVDLQFFSYLDSGMLFATKEKKWPELADIAGLAERVIQV